MKSYMYKGGKDTIWQQIAKGFGVERTKKLF